jgi:hypothetical protein
VSDGSFQTRDASQDFDLTSAVRRRIFQLAGSPSVSALTRIRVS